MITYAALLASKLVNPILSFVYRKVFENPITLLLRIDSR